MWSTSNCQKCASRILDFFSAHNTHFFIHTWENEDVLLKRSDKVHKNSNTKHIASDEFNEVCSLFNPKKFMIEPPIDFTLPMTQSQQYSFLQSHSLKTAFENESNVRYDVVVKCRFDVIWHPFINFQLPENFDPSTLYVSKVDNAPRRPVMLDRFFFSGSEVMSKISTLFSYSSEKLKDLKHLHVFPGIRPNPGLYPEEIFYSFVNQELKIKIREHLMMECIMRETAAHLDVYKDFDEIRKIGHEFYQH